MMFDARQPELNRASLQLALVAGLCAWLTSLCVLAEAAQVARSDIQIPLRDGVQLNAELFLPSTPRPYSTVLRFTPYGTQDRRQIGHDLAAGGFALLHVNVRGTGGSGGTFLPFINETPDLVEVADWAISQPWSNGRVGLTGSSSGSYSAQLLAATGHPAIKTLVNVSGLTDTEELFFPGGAFRLNTLYPWLQFFYLGKPVRDMEEWHRRFMATPMNAGFEWEPGLLRKMASNKVAVAEIGIPMLHFTGWNDVVYRQTLSLFMGAASNPKFQQYQHIMIGPWMHNQIGSNVSEAGDMKFPEHSRLPREALHSAMVEWFRQYLDGAALGLERRAPVRSYRMGEDRWYNYAQWPPRSASPTRYHLRRDPASPAGTLATDRPKASTSKPMHYNPENPVPTFGGVNSHIFPQLAGPRDQSQFLDRDDVLVFTSEPLTSPLVLSGPMSATITASSTCQDYDLVAKVIVQQADGLRRIVEDGVIRASSTSGYVAKRHDEPQVLAIDIGHVDLALPENSRLEVHLAGSNFPKYDRNPCVITDSLDAESYSPGVTTVYFGGEHESYVTLSIQR